MKKLITLVVLFLTPALAQRFEYGSARDVVARAQEDVRRAADFTRDGARYATTHCWTGNGDNVMTYMRSHVPRMIDMDQFQQGQAELAVTYYSRDPDTGSLVDFTCASGECSVDCIPDAVTVRVSSYEFRRFVNFLGLPAVPIPDFRTSLPMESAGCDPEQATCLP